MKEAILLIGAGPMAVEYAKVLKAMKISMIVIGRGIESARNFEKETKIPAVTGGLEPYLKNTNSQTFKKAIVASREDTLGTCTRALIEHGIKEILVEKPGGCNAKDIRKVSQWAKKYNASVYVGYNRRFYASVQKARQMISEDGGVVSCIFEFTEWVHRIPEAKKNSGIAKEWFLANSTHVIDLAFFLCGKPKTLCCYTKGGLDWHPKASIYAGAGITQKNVLFAYHANWESAGRWWAEALTRKRRYIFRPLEKLHVQNIGSVEIEEVSLDDDLDIRFKPGIYRQVQSFLGNKMNLLTMAQQVEMLTWYEKMNK